MIFQLNVKRSSVKGVDFQINAGSNKILVYIKKRITPISTNRYCSSYWEDLKYQFSSDGYPMTKQTPVTSNEIITVQFEFGVKSWVKWKHCCCCDFSGYPLAKWSPDCFRTKKGYFWIKPEKDELNWSFFFKFSDSVLIELIGNGKYSIVNLYSNL